MAQTKKHIQSLLDALGMRPRERFGQNFMIDQNLVRLIADAGNIQRGDRVLEVGPGTGTLTEELLERGASVIAVEIDRDLSADLRERYAGNDRFALIEGDALAGKHALNPQIMEAIDAQPDRPLKLVANLPYNIASPLVIELLIAGAAMLVFTVQKEVAERLIARENDDAYGPLSVMAALLSRVDILRTLPPQAFWPQPKIDSALVRMTRDDTLGGEARSVGRFVQKLFSFRRKTIRKALAQMELDAAGVITALSLDPQARPETLAPATLGAMFDHLKPALRSAADRIEK